MSAAEQLISIIENGENEKVSGLLEPMDIREVNKVVGCLAALHASCGVRNDQALDKLLSKDGIDVNVKTSGGWTPLHTASSRNNVYAVSRLIAIPQVDVNAMTLSESTALHIACANNHREVGKILLDSPGIQVNITGRRGITPVMVSAANCNMKVLEMMLEDSRVDLNTKDKEGRTLEEWVGYWGSGEAEKKTCLNMIEDEKMKREHGRMEKQPTQDGTIGRRLEKVDRLNKEIGNVEEKMKRNVEISKQKRKNLKRQQTLEKEKLAEKHKEEEAQLEMIITTEAEANQRCIGLLKEQREELVQDLQKIRIDPDQDASEDFDKLQAALSKQEDAKRALECPVCFDLMRPPTRIWMCEFSHLTCETCKDRLAEDVLGGGKCPTCTTQPITLRAFMAEQFAQITFN